MPLFKHKEPEPVHPAPEPTRVSNSTDGSRHGFFSRRRSTSPDTSHSSASPTSHSGSTRRSGLFNRNGQDPSIVAARERVQNAEAAEREADRALVSARNAVREARDHVKRIEAEAAEEARLAKIKQGQAADISKRAKPLGRHDRF